MSSFKTANMLKDWQDIINYSKKQLPKKKKKRFRKNVSEKHRMPYKLLSKQPPRLAVMSHAPADQEKNIKNAVLINDGILHMNTKVADTSGSSEFRLQAV